MAENGILRTSTIDHQHEGKTLPTTQGKKGTKKHFIKEYAKNRPLNALEIVNIAKKLDTTSSYVYKVLSLARNEGKKLRGRKGRIFAHGKTYYQCSVMPDTVAMLSAPVLNQKTGMKQIGYKGINPCSCQIHPNGRIIIWPHSTGWKEWLKNELSRLGWPQNVSNFAVDQAMIHFSSLEAGAKPTDAAFLPETLYLEAEWGVVIVKDNSPEKGVLEVKLDIPNMQDYLGLPEIKKRLAVIEQGSVTLNQSYKTVVALLVSIERQWDSIYKFLTSGGEESKSC